MMLCDAKWLARVLGELKNEEICPLLNIGSSTRHFREVEQPFIHEYVFKPLIKRNVKVIHTDLKRADGVDVTADIFDDEALQILREFLPRSIICTHMFEHIKDRHGLAQRLMSLLPVNGVIFVTVPFSYHYHADPIDTMYRPSPDELAELFPGMHAIVKEVLIGGNYWGKVRQRPLVLFCRHFFRFFAPFLGLSQWKRSMRKLYWLFNPYKVSAVMGRKV